MVSPDLPALSASHESSISTILMQLFSSFDAHSILITDLTPSSFTVSYANGDPETYLLHSKRTVPLSPSLPSLADAGARIEQMAAELQLKPVHGKSSIVIKEYRIPKGAHYWKIIAWGTLSTIIWPLVRTLILGGNLFHDLSGLFRGEWIYGIPAFFSLGTMVEHFVQAAIVIVPRLWKYNVSFGSILWWKWYMAHLVGGMSSPWTLDEIVADEEKKMMAESKKEL